MLVRMSQFTKSGKQNSQNSKTEALKLLFGGEEEQTGDEFFLQMARVHFSDTVCTPFFRKQNSWEDHDQPMWLRTVHNSEPSEWLHLERRRRCHLSMEGTTQFIQFFSFFLFTGINSCPFGALDCSHASWTMCKMCSITVVSWGNKLNEVHNETKAVLLET